MGKESLELRPSPRGWGRRKERQRLEEMKQELELDDHKLDVKELEIKYGTSATKGLSEAEAAARLQRDGPNALRPPRGTPGCVRFGQQLAGGLQCLIWVAAAICLIAYGVQRGQGDRGSSDNLYLAVALIAVVVVTGCFGYYQEFKSTNIIASFRNLVPQQATVVRAGQTLLDLGDLVEIKGGDRVLVDIRVLAAQGCKVDNSSLTRESEPQTRSPECTHESHLETRNIAFFSTMCLEGRPRGLVIGTGERTVIGRIASLASGVGNEKTPIAVEIEHFVDIIAGLAVFFGATFFLVAMLIGYPLLRAAVFFMAIVVAYVPEGLLATVTVRAGRTWGHLGAPQGVGVEEHLRFWGFGELFMAIVVAYVPEGLLATVTAAKRGFGRKTPATAAYLRTAARSRKSASQADCIMAKSFSSVSRRKRLPEMRMKSREDKSPRQNLVEEAILSSSTVQEPNGEEKPAQRGTANTDRGNVRRKDPPWAGKAAED
nr:potassium-transporting ATPase alpha chain 1-like [Taeniopygia guttata]